MSKYPKQQKRAGIGTRLKKKRPSVRYWMQLKRNWLNGKTIPYSQEDGRNGIQKKKKRRDFEREIQSLVPPVDRQYRGCLKNSEIFSLSLLSIKDKTPKRKQTQPVHYNMAREISVPGIIQETVVQTVDTFLLYGGREKRLERSSSSSSETAF